MAEITFGGLATGLPTDEIVTKLMALQRRPLDRLTSEKENEATRLKAYAQLNTRLDDLKKAADAMNITSEVRTTKVTLSSESAFTATSSNASTGSYNITVAQLAQAQKNVSIGYSSKTAATFGTGTLTVNGKAITIDSTNNSLQGLQSAINAQSTTTGVSATIINDGNGASPYHLVLTGKDASTSFLVGSALTGGLGVELTNQYTQDAQQAVTFIDGLKVTSNSNTITDVISGVTLNLSAASTKSYAGTSEVGVDSWDWADPPIYVATAMDVSADPTALKEKISTFVSSYNKIMDWINQGYETKTATDTTTTDTTTTATTTEEDILSDYLRGDSTVNSIKRGLQSILTDSVNGTGSLHILSDIGISTNKNGTITLNSSKLDTALEGGLDGMVTLLAGEDTVDGVMKKFNSYLVDLTSGTEGMYAEKKDRYKTRVERLDTQIAQKETLMEKIEQTMRARFNAMELLVSNLNSQSSYITQLSNMWSNNK
ncbi:MAG: flagellar filament capping protein FliD [Desulfoprunum sp.]|nr:flagellar filament capping protein FliD [Desulfoprunum sp.]